MPAAPLPPHEAERLRTLRKLHLLDTPPEERFDRITRIAQRLFDVPIALVTFVDADRQWFKSRQGLDVKETPRDVSFCAHAIHGDELFIIPDASRDERFAGNPLVLGEPGIRFYAGAPLAAPDGRKVGTLCLIDRRPRELTSEQKTALRDLADLAQGEFVQSAGHRGRASGADALPVRETPQGAGRLFRRAGHAGRLLDDVVPRRAQLHRELPVGRPESRAARPFRRRTAFPTY